jgi:hypothetical protein
VRAGGVGPQLHAGVGARGGVSLGCEALPAELRRPDWRIDARWGAASMSARLLAEKRRSAVRIPGRPGHHRHRDDATQAPSGPAPVAVRARRVGMGHARKTNVPVGPTQSSSQAPIIGARRWRHRASLVPRHRDCPEPARHLGQHVCAFNPCRRTLAVYRGKAVRHTVCEADLVSVGPDNGLKPDGSGHDSAKAGRSIDVRALAFSQK